MKRWYVQLAILLVIGMFLASTTFDLIQELRHVGHSEVLGWLSLSGAGVGISFGAMLLLIFIFGIDASWLLFFVVWLIKKRSHIESKDNTLYLP